ncbi:DUF1403 family protein [Methylosinus sp. H3A]|uniref:DUF1403 family protein n=1 Tax=Methylosinus sp. H3A TaxID=2785786 RepID=UPI001AEE3438
MPDALAHAAELARRSDRLRAVAPELRAKGTGRVVALLHSNGLRLAGCWAHLRRRFWSSR